jgi:hypothetical protein
MKLKFLLNQNFKFESNWQTLLKFETYLFWKECEIWNEFCAAAVQLKNPRYQCIGKSVFYYEPQQQSWDKSRQLCSQKFYGSYWADLVELSDNRIKDAIDMMKSLQDLKVLINEEGLFNCSRINFHL